VLGKVQAPPGFDSGRTCDDRSIFDYIERFHNPRMRRRVVRRDLEFSIVLKPSVETG